MKIGFIGLGNLGAIIAGNILESGHELYVYNRTASKAEPLVIRGAKEMGSVKALAAECAYIITMVSDDKALQTITEGPDGLVHNMQPGGVHLSMSTILPLTADELSQLHTQNGSHYLATPVFGRPEAARARKLNFVVSGAANLRQQFEQLLKDAGGAGVWDFGDNITAANTVKLCGNFTIAAAMEAIGEGTALAKNSGVDAHKMWDFLSQTIFTGPIYQGYSKIITNQQFKPAAFSAQLGLKDLNLVLSQAEQVNQNMPLADLLKHHMLEVIKKDPEIDWSAVSLGGQQ